MEALGGEREVHGEADADDASRYVLHGVRVYDDHGAEIAVDVNVERRKAREDVTASASYASYSTSAILLSRPQQRTYDSVRKAAAKV